MQVFNGYAIPHRWLDHAGWCWCPLSLLELYISPTCRAFPALFCLCYSVLVRAFGVARRHQVGLLYSPKCSQELQAGSSSCARHEDDALRIPWGFGGYLLR